MKNVREVNLKKGMPLIIIFVFSIIIMSFLLNNFSFKFLKTAKYWAAMVPMLLLFPFLLIASIEDDESSTEK